MLLASAHAHAREPPTPANQSVPTPDASESETTESGTTEPSVLAAPHDPDAVRRQSWIACVNGAAPCVRSRPARALLLSLGMAGGALAAGLLFGLGDRLAPGDPATLLVGLSGLAGAGALAGMLAGRLGPDGPAAPDRLRPPTLSLAHAYSGPQILDETRPHSLTLRIAPNLFLPHGHGRARLFGHVGGWLNPARDVDPRPQLTEALPEQQGTAPRVLEQRHVSIGVGIDLAVNLPYPVLAPRRSAQLGAAELRYRPEVQIRRDRFAPDTPESTVLERTMLLPLTAGVRWHLSPRQRFTVYFGPRFDFVAFSDPASAGGSDRLHRGGPQRGLLYGEAWYDIDVPLTARPRRDDRVRSLHATGQLTLGYVHSGFDGQGFDFGPVVGFLGPLHLAWSTRLRPVGSPVAAQLGAFARIGSGTTLGLELGVVAPDLHARGRTSR